MELGQVQTSVVGPWGAGLRGGGSAWSSETLCEAWDPRGLTHVEGRAPGCWLQLPLLPGLPAVLTSQAGGEPGGGAGRVLVGLGLLLGRQRDGLGCTQLRSPPQGGSASAQLLILVQGGHLVGDTQGETQLENHWE